MNVRIDTWLERDKGVDPGIIGGAALSLMLILIAVLSGGSNVLQFFDIPSIFIVVGGTLGATLVNFSVNDLQFAWQSLQNVIFKKEYRVHERIRYLVELGTKVRTEGILFLESASAREPDSFLRLGLEVTVDGQSAEDVRRILENEMRTTSERNHRAIQVFQTMGAYAPAMGLIGTLIGLIQMLSSLNDPATVGPAMSIALITTFYGALLANLFFLPIAGKLRNKAQEEVLSKAITVEGVLSIGKLENPIVIEQRLKSFLPPL